MLELVAESGSRSELPIVFLYLNPVYTYGFGRHRGPTGDCQLSASVLDTGDADAQGTPVASADFR